MEEMSAEELPELLAVAPVVPPVAAAMGLAVRPEAGEACEACAAA